MLTLTINGTARAIEVPPEMPLLWVLRDVLGLNGTKFGCGVGQCGACTVQMDGIPIRACLTPAAALVGHRLTTIEGLGTDTHPHVCQRAWLELNVPQCGYCQPGQLMSASALLAAKGEPSDEDIDAAMSGNLCRCGTYPRIRAGIKRAAELARGEAGLGAAEAARR